MTGIKEALESIFKEYPIDRAKPFTANPFKKVINDDFSSALKTVFPEFGIPDSDYFIKGSFGQGNWADVPWFMISLKTITSSAIHGYYIAYLLSKDGNAIYLVLMMGTDSDSPKGETFDSLNSIFNSSVNYAPFHTGVISLRGSSGAGRPKNYENNCFCYKKYEKGKLPDDSVLKDDLKKMIEIYKSLAKLVPVKTKGGSPKIMTKEEVMVDYIEKYIGSKGFTYPDGFIRNFYLCLKSKPFVILAGVSGTGKTKLVKLFAEAIKKPEVKENYKLVPVRPDWSDPSELLGHKNLDGSFTPGLILDFINEAQNDPENPYFLCLDEMNLARVEYYFSDVLSIMETREFTDSSHTKIQTSKLINPQILDDQNKAIYENLYIPDNLYIVGTVNMDETTFPFSKKVLDRANMIEFSDIKLDAFTPATSLPAAPSVFGNDYFISNFLTISDCLSEPSLKDYCGKLELINSYLHPASSDIGYRVRDEICFYLLNNEKYGLLDPKIAFDNEIMQKILPRLQGSSIKVRTMLVNLFNFCVNDSDTISVKDDDTNLVDNMEKLLPSAIYKRSAEKILFMIRRYIEDDFTSYWL